MKKARIITTIGPASNKITVIEEMAKAGMNICRLNFSFGSYEEHTKTIGTIRQAAEKLGRAIPIMQCLQGPKIRMGKLKNPVTVKKGQEIILSGNTVHKSEFYLPTTYSQIASDTEKGKTILVADGKIILSVVKTDKNKKEVTCKVVEEGTILTGKGINLPYTKISLPSLTPKDIEDVKFAVKSGIDYIALSFVRHQDDIIGLKKMLKKLGAPDKPVIAKIEKPEALDHIDEIIAESDGIMVARGDLADEISFAKVPAVQKMLIHKANRQGKITIIATEMMSSMIESQLPTRAEVSDVANGIIDGTDVVMLSNESAMGKYPVEAVRCMAEIVEETEKAFHHENFFQEMDLPGIHKLDEALCSSAAYLSYDLDNAAIVMFTRNGDNVKILSKFRPMSPIYAITDIEAISRKIAFLHNVTPILIEKIDINDQKAVKKRIPEVMKLLKDRYSVRKGQTLIIVDGDYSATDRCEINTIRVHTME